jgi:P2-related tail formation protein
MAVHQEILPATMPLQEELHTVFKRVIVRNSLKLSGISGHTLANIIVDISFLPSLAWMISVDL